MTSEPTHKDDGDPDAKLYEMNPTGRFSDRVEDYVKFRPTYPDKAIDFILEGLVDPAMLTAADVGAGTGISARMLADRGVRVIAIEPNADMRQGAQPHQLIEWKEGTAEATGLGKASVDLVVCAQAFHWFRAPEALSEFHRILRPGGRLALMWNKRFIRDPLTGKYTAAIRKVSGEHKAQMMPFDPKVVEKSGLFTAPILKTAPHHQTLNRDGLVGRATSASYAPKDGPLYDELVRLLHKAHQTHARADGTVDLRYTTQVFISTRISNGHLQERA